MFTVLMMAGGAGVGSLDTLAARVLELPESDLQLVALAGRNADLLGRLQALAASTRGACFRWVSPPRWSVS